MIKKNYRSANLTLGVITLGFLISYPFHANFLGGLISSGCTAGMIGGLADWFAVTALFRRPLGIRPNKILRTEIIPQNRERIFAALTEMVQEELLSQDVLRNKLSALDFSAALLMIMADQHLQDTVKNLLSNLTEETSSVWDSAELKLILANLAQENLADLNLSQIFAEFILFTADHGDLDRLSEALCRIIEEFLDKFEVNTALTNMMEAALIRYGENNPARKLVEKFLPSPSVLARGLQDKAKAILQDGTAAEWLKTSALHFAGDLRTNPVLQEHLNNLLLKMINEVLTPSKEERSSMFLWTSPDQSATVIRRLSANLTNHWQDYLVKLENKTDLRLKINDNIRRLLEKQISKHHDIVGRLVREGLEPLTNDMLVELIEDKAGNDLQMIRINGSVVGGLAGMLIYVLGMVLR